MFRWRYLDAEDRETGASEGFPDRAAAEGWLGEAWPRLLEDGVEQVVLMDAERELYRMGLREA